MQTELMIEENLNSYSLVYKTFSLSLKQLSGGKFSNTDNISKATPQTG